MDGGDQLASLLFFGIPIGILVWYTVQVGVLEPKRKKEQWLKDQIEKTKNKSYWDEWDGRH